MKDLLVCPRCIKITLEVYDRRMKCINCGYAMEPQDESNVWYVGED